MSSVLGWIVKLIIWGGLIWLVFTGLYIVAADQGFLHLMPVSDGGIIVALFVVGLAIPIVLWIVKFVLQLVWAVLSGIAEGLTGRTKGTDHDD